MLSVIIVKNTASSIEFKTVSSSGSITFDSCKVFIDWGNNSVTVIDTIDRTLKGKKGVAHIDSATGHFIVNLNSLPFYSAYYKTLFVETYNTSNMKIDETEHFMLQPDKKDALYGIVRKLHHDFSLQAKLSGTSLAFFFEDDLTKEHCPVCWDNEIGQRISSSCDTCNGTGYLQTGLVKREVLSMKQKNQAKQLYEGKGLSFEETAVFTTYDRLDFTKGILFYDTGDKEIYEITDRNISNVGGIRTSTRIIASSIKPNDTRVDKIRDLIV